MICNRLDFKIGKKDITLLNSYGKEKKLERFLNKADYHYFHDKNGRLVIPYPDMNLLRLMSSEFNVVIKTHDTQFNDNKVNNIIYRYKRAINDGFNACIIYDDFTGIIEWKLVNYPSHFDTTVNISKWIDNLGWELNVNNITKLCRLWHDEMSLRFQDI